jgi:NAD(P)-dependent dehydrogenase (short-subunit alcohol dehydrogenase family)
VFSQSAKGEIAMNNLTKHWPPWSPQPCLIEAPIIEAQFPDKAAADQIRGYFASITPLGRVNRPEEIASIVLILAPDESSYITGIDLPFDGGVVV